MWFRNNRMRKVDRQRSSAHKDARDRQYLLESRVFVLQPSCFQPSQKALGNQ